MAALPGLLVEPNPTVPATPPPRNEDAPKYVAHVPTIEAVSAVPATALPPGEMAPAPRPTAPEATIIAPVEIPSAPEPAASPPAAAALAAKPSPHVSATEIAELLARGDALLRIGDIASARLFYERAADAGDGQAAMRVGATFDPTFLGRAGLRGAHADPVVARSWYQRAANLSAAGVERQPKGAETK